MIFENPDLNDPAVQTVMRTDYILQKGAAFEFGNTNQKHTGYWYSFQDNEDDKYRQKLVEEAQKLYPFDLVVWVNTGGNLLGLDRQSNSVQPEAYLFDLSSFTFNKPTTAKTEQLFRDTQSYENYQKAMDGYWHSIKDLNARFYILEVLYQFPFSILSTPEITNGNTFFRTAFYDMLAMFVIEANSLIKDNTSDDFTLRKFKNNKLLNLVRPELKPSFIAYFEKTKDLFVFKRWSSNLNILRNEVYAHFKEWRLNGGTPNLISNNFDLEELRQLVDIIMRAFESLNFAHINYQMFPSSYDENKRKDGDTDIVKMLNQIAQNSGGLHLPEKDSQKWQDRKAGLEPRLLQSYNRYRVDFGLPPV